LPITIITLGVYGFTETSFFQALRDARVDALVDVRWRRGVRGSRYAFANSQRLQARLEQLDIPYLHRRDLAPTPEIRQRQKEADKHNRVAKRKRTRLGAEFSQAYLDEILAPLDPQTFLNDLPPETRRPALFCVERDPAACHRSLLADHLAAIPGVGVIHL
jgi:uncharacterized protein (DUF488 family)